MCIMCTHILYIYICIYTCIILYASNIACSRLLRAPADWVGGRMLGCPQHRDSLLVSWPYRYDSEPRLGAEDPSQKSAPQKSSWTFSGI